MAHTRNPQDRTQVYKGKTVINELIQIAAEYIEKTPDDILNHGRQPILARARQAAYLVAYESGMNPYQIGRAMNRDRKTIVYGIDIALEMYRREPKMAKLIDALRSRSPVKRKKLPELLPIIRADLDEELSDNAKIKRGSIMLAAAIQRARAA